MNSHRRSTRILAAGLTGAAACGAWLTAAPAHAVTAATVRLVDTAVVYDGGTGQVNDVRVHLDRGTLVITDLRAPMTTTPGSGCTVTGSVARCGTGITGLSMSLGDLDDKVQVEAPLSGQISTGDGNDVIRSAVTGGLSKLAYDGGAGTRDVVEYRNASSGVTVSLDDVNNDGRSLVGDRDNVRSTVERLTGSTFDDTLIGNDTNNTLDGLPGNDTLRGLGGTDFFPSSFVADGADSVSGGTGNDAVSYSNRTRGVVVDLDDVADDGEAGERDNLGADVEGVNGTRFADVLIGSASANQLEAFEGDDVLSGLGGADSLRGGDGADAVTGGAGNDSLTLNDDDDRDDLACGADVDRVTVEIGVDRHSDCETLL